MFHSKKILLFPGKLPKNIEGFTFLSAVKHVFSLPLIIEKDLSNFLVDGEGDDDVSLLGKDVNYLLCHPEVNTPAEISLLLDRLREEEERIIVLGSEKVVYEIFEQLDDCYIHVPEKGDEECFIEFYIHPEYDAAIPLSVYPIHFGMVCRQ